MFHNDQGGLSCLKRPNCTFLTYILVNNYRIALLIKICVILISLMSHVFIWILFYTHVNYWNLEKVLKKIYFNGILQEGFYLMKEKNNLHPNKSIPDGRSVIG